MSYGSYNHRRPTVLCGCYYYIAPRKKSYLPAVNIETHSTILSTTSRTKLQQTFTNPSKEEAIEKCHYTFPLYDGVSVVEFTCHVGERVLRGIVKEKAEAKKTFDQAVAKGQTAGLFEQSEDMSDTFTTILGKIPAGASIKVDITYVGELKHDAEADGIRLTIPTFLAPRYGPQKENGSGLTGVRSKSMKITVDVNMADGSSIKSIQSPSHPIAVSMGVLSSDIDADPGHTKASATLSLETTILDTDFILIVKAKDTNSPKALLETHPTIPNHRAIMATLIPKFVLPQLRPEIVFLVDRSGSMHGNMQMVISAIKVFLQSLPPGVKFNICSFGSVCSFLWPKSKDYTRDTLKTAISNVEIFEADMFGTETLQAIVATVDQRFKDLPLEMILLTDGDISCQVEAFEYLNQQVKKSKGQIRLFPMGVGNGVSHSLIDGLARAGNGFAQSVQVGERIDGRVVRMLKGALSPHVVDYTLEVQYGEEDDFDLVEKVTDNLKGLTIISDSADTKNATSPEGKLDKKVISLFDPKVDADAELSTESPLPLPEIKVPALLQAPATLPALFAFSRFSAYLLLSPSTIQRNPTAVVLHGTSPKGPLHLRIPIDSLSEKGTTIHALAARKAVQDLEEGRGWVHNVKDAKGRLISESIPSRFDEIVKNEAVRLGTTFQTANRWCSFVAVQSDDDKDKRAEEPVVPHVYANAVVDVGGEVFSAARSGAVFSSQRLGGMPSSRQHTVGPIPRSNLCGGVRPPQRMRMMTTSQPVSFGGRKASEAGESHSPALDAKSVDDGAKTRELMKLQDIEGFWEKSARIAALLGIEEKELEGEKNKVWVTALVVLFLERMLQSEKDVWDLVAEKARAWLAGEESENVVKAMEARAELVLKEKGVGRDDFITCYPQSNRNVP